jgi:hypothetical protein
MSWRYRQPVPPKKTTDTQPKVRTTIYLPADMHRALKVYAATTGNDMSSVIVELLRKAGIK